MNVVLWARVSSREQREGYSIDAQLRLTRARALENGWAVVREFVVAESARRGAERVAFNEMFAWVKANAKRQTIGAILSHKLDRVCRNMRDAVRLQELGDTCGVKLEFVDNQFGPGAAGTLSFNVMAAVAQYYSDNLRAEVLKGKDEKVRQGWPPGGAPFGYMNVDDRDEPVQPHPEKSVALVRMFELYAGVGQTFKTLAEALAQEGHTFRPSQPRFPRTALSYILGNRFYIGELHRNGMIYEGRYRRLIDRAIFDACQDIMNGRNHRTGNPEHAYAGGLFTCAFCGRAITGERIRRKLRAGGIREHLYYRCANNEPGPDRPTVRWKADDLEQAILHDLDALRFPSAEVAMWFRSTLKAAVDDLTAHERRQSVSLARRKPELVAMQDRLLNAYLAGTVDEAAYKSKSGELKAEASRLDEALDGLRGGAAGRAETALALFDWCQNAASHWHGSKTSARRQILDAVCLNRVLSDVSLVTTKRKPFDVLAEGLDLKSNRAEGI
jgi:DNA invertase Pin-like site-specific DNA recombinase